MLALAGNSVHAADYYVNPMICTGTLTDYDNSLPNVSTYVSNALFEGMKFLSFQTKKVDGSIAQTLKSFSNQSATAVDPKEYEDKQFYAEYSKPLQVTANYDVATQKNIYSITNGNGLNLTVTSSAVKGKTRIEHLEGTDGETDRTKNQGYGYYQISCDATVTLDPPSNFIDATNQCRTLAALSVQAALAQKGITCTVKGREDYAHQKLNDILVTARCSDHKRYSYTLSTTPAPQGSRGCTIPAIGEPNLVVNLGGNGK